MKRESPSNRVVRIFCDYGAEWPLWEEGLQSPEDYGLSKALSARLGAWNEEFQENMHWDHGWPQGFDEAAWTAAGKQLARDVQQEAGKEIRVKYGV